MRKCIFLAMVAVVATVFGQSPTTLTVEPFEFSVPLSGPNAEAQRDEWARTIRNAFLETIPRNNKVIVVGSDENARVLLSAKVVAFGSERGVVDIPSFSQPGSTRFTAALEYQFTDAATKKRISAGVAQGEAKLPPWRLSCTPPSRIFARTTRGAAVYAAAAQLVAALRQLPTQTSE